MKLTEKDDGRIETDSCACCMDGADEMGPVHTDKNEPIRMGELYPLSRWPKNSRVRRAIERYRSGNGNLVCGNCYFNATDALT